MIIGKIVKSESHVNYVCQIFGPHEAQERPGPADYAFGSFVRIALSSPDADSDLYAFTNEIKDPTTYAVGVIYDTILQNPAFGSLGPRLSNETQVELFSPDYISEKAILTYILILGMIEQRTIRGEAPEYLSASHGVPLLSLELDSEIETMTNEDVRAFHFFNDPLSSGDTSQPYREDAYLHMGYLPHIISQRNSLLPMVTLRIIDQLERLFPQNLALLSIVKRNFAWRLKVETTG